MIRCFALYRLTRETLAFEKIHTYILTVYTHNSTQESIVLLLHSRECETVQWCLFRSCHQLKVSSLLCLTTTLHTSFTAFFHVRHAYDIMPHLTPTKRACIVHMCNQQRATFCDIAREFNISPSTAHTTYRTFKDGHFYRRETRSGRPRVLDCHNRLFARRRFQSGQAKNVADLQRKFYPKVSLSTLQYFLHDNGLKGRRRHRKFFLSRIHAAHHLKWARILSHWTDTHWSYVIFSDETKINLWGSDGIQYCQREDGEAFERQNVDAEMKHGGGNIMVWGCISSRGLGRLVRIDGIMTGIKYCDILEKGLLGTLRDQGFNPAHVVS